MKSSVAKDETRDDLRHVRSRICDMTLGASALVAIPALAASLNRITTMGWRWSMALHILAAVVLCGFFLFRKSLPYGVRAGTIVFLFLAIGFAGFWQFGMVAGANPMLLVAPLLATVLFGRHLGIWFTVAVVAMMVATAYSFVYGGRVFLIDFVIDEKYMPSWITYLLSVVMAVATSVAAITMSNRHLASALSLSRQSQEELTTLNRDLEAQVAQRTLELEAAKLEAERQARTDVLTGLNNRRAFFELGEAIDAQSRRYDHTYVVAMIDIDHFKGVNDTWGHEAGNLALQGVANIVGEMLRESDIFGRIGGEEFAVILPETGLQEGAALAERLREAIEGVRIETVRGLINVTISVGVAALDASRETLETVVADADAAMYRAKNAGRNKVEVHQSPIRMKAGE